MIAVAAAVAAAVALLALVVLPGRNAGRTDDPAAVSRRLAGGAEANRAEDPLLAAQLALAAYQVEPSAEAQRELVATFFGMSAVPVPERGAPIVDVALDGSGRTLAEVDGSGRVRVWKVGEDRQVTLAATVEAGDTGHAISAALTTDGGLLALGSRDHSVRIWDITDRAGGPRQVGRLDSHVSPVHRVNLYTERKILVTASDDGVVKTWDVSDPAQGRLLASVTGQTGPVTDMAFRSEDGMVATAGVNGTVRLWDASDPRRPTQLGLVAGHLGAVGAVAFSPDGQRLATGGDDQSLRLWDSSSYQEIARVTAHPALVTSVAFAGEELLLTGGADGTAVLWDLTRAVGTAGESIVRPAETARVEVGAAVDQPPGHRFASGLGPRIAVGGDGRTVAVGDADGGLRVLSIEPDVLVEIACADPRNRVSRETWKQWVPELPYADPCPK